MLSTYLTMAIVVIGSLLVGRAAMVATGSQKWSGLEPAVGFAAIMTVEGLLARVPGTRTALILGFAALILASIWILRRPRRADLPPSGWFWVAAALAVAVTSIPFAISGHWGLLGMGYNNDLGLHLAWAEWLRSGFGTEPSGGYPLGPHGLAASLSFLPRLTLGPVFIGQIIAIAVITVMTTWEAVKRLPTGRRLLAALLAGLPYLMVAYFAQAAFKELATAAFLLAFAIGLSRLAPLPAGRKARVLAVTPLLILLLGIVFTYSFPGLAWPAAVALAWGLAEPVVRRHLRPSAVWKQVSRPPVAAGLLIGLGLLAALAFSGPFGFGDAFSEVATSDAFGPVSALEGLGVWLTPDYRLDGTFSTPLPGLMGAIGVLALLAALFWWSKQPKSIYPLAFLGCLGLYLISLPWVGDYSLAKALVISAPIVMVVILTALLSGPASAVPSGERPGRSSSGGSARIAWATLASIFIVMAAASSFLVLRDASVSPPGHAAELDSFRRFTDGKTVLYMDQDRFAPYYLSGAEVGVPLNEFPDPDVTENEKKPFQGDNGKNSIDFDSFDRETLQHHDFVVTTAAGWTSMTPPFYEEVARTGNYILWRRTGPAFGRPIMRENTMPAKLVDCENEGGRYFSALDGTATLLPDAEVGLRSDWAPDADLTPGQSASATLDLEPGEYRVSLQYYSPEEIRLNGPGFSRTFPAAIDGQRLANIDSGSSGMFWPGGLIEIDRAGPVEFTVEAAGPSTLQKLTGYSRPTKLGRIVLSRNRIRSRVPMKQICDRWVDFFRRAESLNAGGAGVRPEPGQ
ncbi:MAG: hypothetical protein JJE10_05455 [Thermoleophilia bacterium]|nr:hypothetical protein [Thermoleophilia bacterium]